MFDKGGKFEYFNWWESVLSVKMAKFKSTVQQ